MIIYCTQVSVLGTLYYSVNKKKFLPSWNLIVFGLQLYLHCPTLCNPLDYSPSGSSFHRIFQERILERILIPFSRESLPDPEIKPASPVVSSLKADSLLADPLGKPSVWIKQAVMSSY